jgi:hypothetical protein
MIYRSIWEEDFVLYDSVSTLEYHDDNTESGVRYNYAVSAKNTRQLESAKVGPVSAIPVALDKDILFYDMNQEGTPHFDPYQPSYVELIANSLQPILSVEFHDIDDESLQFKKMSRYSVVVFDSEKRGGKFPVHMRDSLGYYFAGGGRALFIIPNASANDLSIGSPKVNRFEEGNFFKEFLHLDSSVTNGIVLRDNALWGDLEGCQAQSSEHLSLTVDSAKLAAAPVEIQGAIPLAGCLYPDDDVEVWYRYQSLYPDSIFHDQINGIAYTDSACRFVLFNFQLSLMSETSSIIALRQALEYLGVDVSCGDVNADYRVDIGDAVFLIDFLYREGPPPVIEGNADVNCDEGIDLGDAMEIINIIFRNTSGLNCCRD